ncbi:MAG: metallopeptidase family protein [Alphaproteobacteria bacterium]
MMKARALNAQQIIMNFTAPPSVSDLEGMATGILQGIPDELLEFCEGIALRVEEFPDEATEQELDLESPYDLLALYKSGREISPGVEKKTANDDDLLVLYRRPLLDMWCESCEDLAGLIRQVMIEEFGRHFDFSEGEIEEMTSRHYQGML